MSGRGIVAAGRRKPPARRREAGPTVPCRPPTHRYHDFDNWIALGLDLVAYYAALVDCIESLEAADAKPSEPWLWSERPEARLKRRLALDEAAQALLARFSAAELDAAVAEFGAGWRWFERGDNYEGPRDRRVVSIDFVAGRVAMLIGAFPSGTPTSPDVFARRLIEEILCLEVTASRIELATRTLIRTRKFLPAISEVLATVRDARTPERDSAFDVDDGEPMILWARRALAVKASPRLPPGGAR
jgi:hypothetical protein